MNASISPPSSKTLHSTFGSVMIGRQFEADTAVTYRFGFNGKEKTDEIYGDGNGVDFGARIYDSRLGRWMSVDPNHKSYPAISTYVFSLNSPLLFNDPDGKDARVTVQKNPEGGGKITISSTIYITGKAANKSNEELYNKKATELYKSGTYTNKAGEKFEVVYEVKFEYVSDKSKIELKDGDNILEYNENVGRSGVNGTYNADIDRKGNISNVKRFTGNSGEIAKGDESDHNATIHETLHFVGLSDRYDDIGTESLPDDGFKNDILGSYEGTELNQVHYDNYGETYSTKESGTYTLKERVDTKSSDGSIKGGSSDGKRPIKEAEKK